MIGNRGKPKAVIFDSHTGETLEVEIAQPAKVHYTWVGGFMLLSMDGIRMIQRAHLRGRDLGVLLSMMRQLRGNLVATATMRSLGHEMGMDAPAVSRAIGRLVSAGLVRRGDVRGVIWLNPHIGFKGTARQQRFAVREWDAANRPFEVPERIA